MKPKNFPGRKHRRRMRAQNPGYQSRPEVDDINCRLGSKNRAPVTGFGKGANCPVGERRGRWGPDGVTVVSRVCGVQ